MLATTSVNCKNLYSYAENNPVMAKDSTGNFFETVFDVVTLGCSIVDVFKNPKDPSAWLNLVGDIVDLIPFVTGVGEAVRGARAASKLADKAADVGDMVKAASKADVIHDAGKGVKGGSNDKLFAQIKGNSYDINKLKKTQSYTYADNVSSIKKAIVQNGPNAVPPINIRVHHGQALVVDGHHRLEAFKQLGYDRVPIKYLHSSQLGRNLPNGTYYRSIEELLDAAIGN